MLNFLKRSLLTQKIGELTKKNTDII